MQLASLKVYLLQFSSLKVVENQKKFKYFFNATFVYIYLCEGKMSAHH